jgi:hypothetical protein
MFRPAILAVFREVFFEERITQNVKVVYYYYYYYYYYCLLTATEFLLGGTSPYISTDKTNKNKYT